jgi:hypothetical protein
MRFGKCSPAFADATPSRAECRQDAALTVKMAQRAGTCLAPKAQHSWQPEATPQESGYQYSQSAEGAIQNPAT